jgi:membrane-associated phospholipid phosphatase
VRHLVPRRPRVAAAGLALFVLTAALVAAGVLGDLDQFAVSHLMPWLDPHRTGTVTLRSLTLPQVGGSVARTLVGLWTYPAAVLPSVVLVALCARRLPRRDAAAWLAIWAAGNAVELVGKLVISRPALHAAHVHVIAFDGSLPSGHTIRSVVVSGAAWSAGRAGRYAALWAAGVPFALVALGDHTPTDVAAGLFVALALVGWAPGTRPGVRTAR